MSDGKLTKRRVSRMHFQLVFRVEPRARVYLDMVQKEIVAALNAAALAGKLSVAEFLVGYDPEQGD